jgi:hypothetical protein
MIPVDTIRRYMAVHWSLGMVTEDIVHDSDVCPVQVEGPKGMKLLGAKVGAQGPLVMWHGSLAAASATAVGHFPWFYTFNLLQAYRLHRITSYTCSCTLIVIESRNAPSFEEI